MTLFLWSEMKAKKGVGGTTETKTDEGRRRKRAIVNRDSANDTKYGVTTPDKNNKHTKTKQKPWTSKQFNWKCWVLQVCGWWAYLLWSILFSMVLPVASDFAFIQTHFKPTPSPWYNKSSNTWIRPMRLCQWEVYWTCVCMVAIKHSVELTITRCTGRLWSW